MDQEKTNRPKLSAWLPITRKEMKARQWDQPDVVLVTGDAYVDHPSFGVAVIGRTLEAEGLRVCIIPQPNWRDDGHEFKKFGPPKLFFGVTGGNMDPMVNHYTAARRLRSDDAYTPGNQAGFRPDRATTVYTKWLKKLYPDVPVVIGGIEASLRRVTHYDYWDDRLMPTILADSGADLLIYGMGEQPIKELVKYLQKGVPLSSLKTIPQTALLIGKDEALPKNKHWEDKVLFSHEECLADKIKFARNSKILEQESNKIVAHRLIQQVGDRTLIVNPPFMPMSTQQIDESFALPYTRLPHPKYRDRGAIPAFEMIKNSINIHRGCFGGCSFCVIAAHQGKHIVARSEASILEEVGRVVRSESFKGTISDLGGPSANMYAMRPKNADICKKCSSASCIYPAVCDNLDTEHHRLTELYKKVTRVPGVKHLFIGSGIRYDLLVAEFNKKGDAAQMREYLDQVTQYHVSGRLKVAPEHSEDPVLKRMRKPSFGYFRRFKELFDQSNARLGKKQKLVPYFISSHPGCREVDMAALALQTQSLDFKPEQVQDFTPTPMTPSADMFYSGVDPYTLEEVYCARTPREKKDQNRFFFWYKPENRAWIAKKLEKYPALKDKLINRK